MPLNSIIVGMLSRYVREDGGEQEFDSNIVRY